VKLQAEGMIRTESLRDDNYRFDRATHTLAGHREGNRYRLGDLLRVAVARVDLERRELDFRLVERRTERTPPAKSATPAREKTGRKTAKSKDVKEKKAGKAKRPRRGR
jgi:ribonuclease R